MPNLWIADDEKGNLVKEFDYFVDRRVTEKTDLTLSLLKSELFSFLRNLFKWKQI
jgi:hypothetical protein